MGYNCATDSHSSGPKKLMKILHVNKYYENVVGGVETILRDIVDGLESKGFQNEVLACDLGPSRIEKIREVNVWYAHAIKVVMSVPVSFSFFWLFYKRIQHADVVFIHHPFPPAALAYLLFGRKKKLYVWYHSDIVRQKIIGFLIRPIILYFIRSADKIFVSSDHIVTTSDTLKGMESRCVTIPFGIDVSKYEKTPEVEKEALQIRKKFGTPLILAVGRLVHYKGFSFVIEAMKGLNAHLLIIGKGKLYGELQDKIKNAHLQKSITILDHADSLLPYYSASDFVVFPSVIRSETFGLVQLEAMASGKPVINTDVHSGVSSVGEDGVTGLTVPKENSSVLHNTMEKLLNDKHLRESFGKNALVRVKERFDMERFVERVSRELT